MEYTFSSYQFCWRKAYVVILVLMERTYTYEAKRKKISVVIILVIMECTFTAGAT